MLKYNSGHSFLLSNKHLNYKKVWGLGFSKWYSFTCKICLKWLLFNQLSNLFSCLLTLYNTLNVSVPIAKQGKSKENFDSLGFYKSLGLSQWLKVNFGICSKVINMAVSHKIGELRFLIIISAFSAINAQQIIKDILFFFATKLR